ncbi:hypothetical protein Agabi119p4_1326 [Agaricus bisporus var. burnettii]|uniref:Uncharacterized protein n=1 Tax=Agaricus bisporus var. burnettii TaxID=192524 RepID=A0A8H7FCZ4_AGABI|nr:hypothetical protein Agabi119p4_1326 [Agaricus bisporus var. burnettii]
MSQDAFRSFITPGQTQPSTSDQRQTTGHTSEANTDESTLQSTTATFAPTVGSQQSRTGGEQQDSLNQLRREYLTFGITHTQAILWGFELLQRDCGITNDERMLQFSNFLSSITKDKQPERGGGSHEPNEPRALVEQLLGEAIGDGEHGRVEEAGEAGDKDNFWDGKDEKDEEARGSKCIWAQDFPWYEDPRKESHRFTDSMRRTRVILELNQKGLELAQHTAQASSAGPPDFPDSEWGNIIRGKPVSLDNVFASLYCPRSLPSRAAHVGGVEIIVQDLEPSKRIEMVADWSTAWRRCTKATSVVFPHRIDELTGYGEHIEGLLASVATIHHWRVFCYDEAVRNTVRGGESLSLLDNAVQR